MQMILNDESKHSYQSRALFKFGLAIPPRRLTRTTYPGWLQAAAAKVD